MPTNESTELALRLMRQLTDTVEQLSGLSDDDLIVPDRARLRHERRRQAAARAQCRA